MDRAVTENPARGHDDAIRRRAVHREDLPAELLQSEGLMQGNGPAHGVLWAFGSHDPDVAELLQVFRKGAETGRFDAVIIGN